MRLKKLSALLLVLVMGASTFVGCGNKAGTTEKLEVSENSANGSKSESTENITLTLMMSGTKSTEGEDFELETLPRLVNEKFPNITLEVMKLPDDQYYTSLKTKLATGEAPDFMLAQPKMAGTNSVFGLAKAGYLLDISDLSALRKAGPGVADFTYEDKVYAVPNGITFLATYYNKDMFEANGLPIPTDWEEFLSACEVLKNAGITPIVMGDKDSYVMQFGLYQVAANRVYPENPKFDEQLSDGTTKFTDGQWEEVLSMYNELYEKGYIVENSLGLGAAQSIQKFIDGEAAMIFDGSFNATAVSAKGELDFERGYFPLPANAPGKETYVAGASGAGFGVYSNTKYPEECKQILEYWYDTESDLHKAWEATGKNISNFEGAKLENPLFEEVMKVYQEGRSFYWCNQAWPAGTENEMQAKFAEVIGKQNVTIKDITEAMQMKFEELYTE